MEKLSKEELLKLIATSEKPKKARKKPDLDEEKKLAMLERLANMRETVKKNREAKKTAVESPAIKEKDIDEVFEKKYGTKFDKMNELLTDLNENTKEVVKLKREKAAKREIKPEPEPEKPAPLAKAPAPPAPVVPVRVPFPIPNTPIFRKGNTRF